VERDGKRRLQGVVEDGIAGAVGEIGDDDGVLVAEAGSAMRAIVKSCANQRCDEHDREGRDHAPGFFF
jgi:hypothetical protein